jgi:hypothetical protein
MFSLCQPGGHRYGKEHSDREGLTESVAQAILKGTEASCKELGYADARRCGRRLEWLSSKSSRGDGTQAAGALTPGRSRSRREGQARKDVLVGQDREVRKDLRSRHCARKATENVYSMMSNAKVKHG